MMMELARAMALEPQLLLLDEPASGLNDTETEAFADVLLRIRARGVTVLLVEHDIGGADGDSMEQRIRFKAAASAARTTHAGADTLG